MLSTHFWRESRRAYPVIWMSVSPQTLFQKHSSSVFVQGYLNVPAFLPANVIPELIIRLRKNDTSNSAFSVKKYKFYKFSSVVLHCKNMHFKCKRLVINISVCRFLVSPRNSC
jgi:hypothetical protein